MCRDCGHEVGTFGRVKELLFAELRRPLAQRSDIALSGDEERKGF